MSDVYTRTQDADLPGGPIERYFVYHSGDAFTGLLAAAGFEILWTACASTHRDWLSLHVRRIPGVH